MVFLTLAWLSGCNASATDPATVAGTAPLRVLIAGIPEEVDPRFVADPHSLRLTRLIFGSLVRMDPQTLEPLPSLAARIDELDPTHYRVVLRKGLRFSNGAPLTSRDVVATFRSVVDPKLGSRYAGTYRRIQRVYAVDRHTVMFVLEGPHATFLTDLELPILRHQDAAAHIRWQTTESKNIVGAGPYRVANYNRRHVMLERNREWHGGIPRYPAVRLDVLRDENTRALRLLSGQADLAVQALGPVLLRRFEAEDGFEVRTAPGINTYYLGVHTEGRYLSDVRVRQAIAHAIDRRLLLDSELDGRGELALGFVPPGHWAANENLKGYDFNQAKASELLDQAGFHRGADGARLRLSLRVSSDRMRVSLARAVAAMLAEVGVMVQVRPSEAGTLIEDLNRGRFELCLLQLPELYEPHLLSWFFASSRIPSPPSFAGANRWRFSNRAVDDALERGRLTSDRVKRRQHYIDAQAVLLEQLPVIPLFHEAVTAVVGRKGFGFVAPRDGRLGNLAN